MSILSKRALAKLTEVEGQEPVVSAVLPKDGLDLEVKHASGDVMKLLGNLGSLWGRDCRISASGRFSVEISRSEINQTRPIQSHYYNYFFTVTDLLLDTKSTYRSLCGPFKRYHRLYFLTDRAAILVDFSRNNSAVTQNLLLFDHENQSVDCELARVWCFDVDDMLFRTDDTLIPITSGLLQCCHRAYLPLLGQRDGTKQTIMARMVPANPFEGIEENVPLITFSMDELWHIAQKQRLRLANTDPLNQLPWTRISLDDTHYPLIYKSSLIFLFRQEKFSGESFLPNAVLEIDFAGVLVDKNSHPQANFCYVRSDITLSHKELLSYYSVAHHGPLLIAYWSYRSGALSASYPLRMLYVLDLDALTWREFRELRDIEDVDARWISILPGCRILSQQQRGSECATVYKIIHASMSVPRLQHLAFWTVVELIKSLKRSSEGTATNGNGNTYKLLLTAYYYSLNCLANFDI
uniref:Mab-21 domain-containing protein n=1 Tax=Ascaris lumbricoides TaxID=6252 RepID=A0A0M3HTV1_ASCLU